MNSRKPEDLAKLNFADVYAQYGNELYRFALRLTGNRADAEDLTQETFVVALTGHQAFRQESSIKTWLYRIAIYKHQKLSRKGHRSEPLFDMEIAYDGWTPRMLEMELAINRLPEKQRIPFILVKVEQFSYAEAGAILQSPEGTVKSHVHDAVSALQKELREPKTQQPDQSLTKPKTETLNAT